jgi:hypothetical protein
LNVGRLLATFFVVGAIAVVCAPNASSAPDRPRDDCPGYQAEGPPRPGIKVLRHIAFNRLAAPGDRIEGSAHYPGGRRFLKTGLYVRGSVPVTVAVREPALMSGWSSDEDTTEITFPQGEDRCAGTGWHVFPGGFVVPRHGLCVRFTVTVGGESQTIPFGIERRC